MTANTKMTEKEAREILTENGFPKMVSEKYKAIGFLEGLQAGRAEMAEEFANRHAMEESCECWCCYKKADILKLAQRDGGNK